MSLTLSRARKRMEDHLNKIGIGRNKNKYGSFEEPLDLSRRNSFDLEHGARDGDLLVVKESKLVNIQLVRDGMFRFAFLMETCHPGTIPDPPLMAAALDLKAPVVARAALYLECAHFIHRCNKGQWPTWMKLNLPMFRPSGPLGNRGTPSGLRRTHILQRAAGRMFYQWAEAIGARLEEMLQREQCDSTENLLAVVDENKKRQYRIEDDEEDFLDEACVNPMGNNCPYALKMAACQLLLEITAFLRETYQYLPHKSSRLSTREKHCFEPRSVTANRRWSMALSSLGFSQNSAHSLVSLAEQGHPFALNERRISFVLHEADAEVESENSSNTTLTVQEDPNCGDEKKGRRIAQGRTHLLRRTPGSAPCHNSSFKRRSLKLKKPVDRKNRPRSSTFAEDDDESYLKRTESIHSRRKVSAVSDRSDTSERADVSGEESPGVLSDEQAPESPNDVLESDDVSLTKNMPWLKVLVQVSSSLNFSCPHQHFCHPNCYRRQMRACNRLVKAVRKVYGDEIGVVKDTEKQPEDKEDSKKEKKLKKIITAPSSPLRRKASVAHNLDKIEKAVDAPHLGALRSLHSSITCLAHDVEAGGTADKGEQKLGPYVKKEPKEELPIVKYLKNQVMTLFHSPLSTLVKGTVVMSDNCFKDIMNVVWKLLLESDQQLAATAAALFTISSVKAPDQASELLEKELKHEDTAQRINAIHRFHALWQFRNQCWPRMEDGAQMYFKVPPPVVEFTLPSPKIAIDSVPIADPPWLPHVKTKVEEVTINQDQSLQRSFVTATKTRRKQQVELIHRALEAEEDKKQTARENFPITSVAVNLHAAYEPALYHAVEEHEEGEEDALTERNMQHHIQMAHPLFPSCLCSSTFHIISLLDDPQVNIDGVAVYEVAYKVIWLCLVEDTALFMRHFLEKLTREKQDVILQILRKLLHFIPRLPPQAAYTLYNYFIGYIMFYVRTPVEGGQELIANALSLVWLVVPSVQGLFFKDLKQILRKEQCDASLLITANVPSAKKIIIHGPDVGGIPSQFPVHEDTQFLHVLQDSFEFFGIEEAEQNSYFLVDTKTNQIHNLESFVRDFYFFKRSQYPQLSLVQMDPEQAFQRQQQQALTLKFLELGKVLMTVSVLKTTNQVLQRVLVLHEELMKLPSFPRKALEADFSLYAGNLGKEMLGIDTLHKLVWVKLVARMFEVMAGFFAHSSDIHLFVNVVNGALVLHCEDCTILRQCLATFINAAQQFKNIFASNGYLLIMPTILRIYSNHQTNSLLCRSIEFVSKQFYIMHRKPFILQMFGSAASILDLDTTSMYGDANKVQSKAFFQLLLSFGQYIVDPLDILGLVKGEKPLRALDFCYQMDPDTLTIQDCISLCVTVVAYAPDSQRGHQMLTILEAVLPFYLNHLQSQTLKKETPGGARTEIQAIHSISVCMKTLITNCEVLARNYTGPHRAIDLRGSSIKNASKGACSPPFEVDEDSHSNFYISRRQQQSQYDRHVEDSEILRAEFRKPRDTILFVISEFLTTCTRRLATLSKKVPDLTSKATELLDLKCHLRLAEIAHSLLKVSPYDPATMACRGLHRYMNEVLPNTEWVQEAMRPALIMVLRRLDKTFNKIAKKQTIKRLVDWEAARSLLKGVYLTLYKHTYIAHLPHLKSLTAVCQGILLGDNYTLPLATESLSTFNTSLAALSQSPPASFVSVAVRLIAMQMLALGDSLTLESVCGGVSAVCSSPEKTEIYLMNLILPMCVRVTSGIKDSLRLCQMDISFALAVIIHGLTPPQSKNTSTGKSVSEGQGPEKSPRKPRSSLFQIGFLGLKVMIVCFEHELAGEWYKIARCIRELGNKLFGGLALWNFLDFVVTHRTPLFILLYPLIKYRILQTICDNEQEYYYQQLIREKLQGFSLPTPKSRGTLLMDLVAEMKALKDDLVSRKLDSYSIGDISQSTSYTRSVIGGAHRPSFTELTSDQHSVTRLGNPPGLVSTGSCHGRGESRGSVTSHKSGLSHQWSVRSDSNVPSRGLSIRLHSRDRSQKVVERFLRRTSYPEHEGAISQDILEGDQAASSEPRLFRKSTLYIKMRGSKKSCGGGSQSSIIGGEEGVDVERSQENITGWRAPTSQPTSRPTSPSGIHSPDHDSDSHRPRHRLQRQKAQSRKTFRFRKSRRSAGFAVETKQPTEEIPMATTMKQLTLAEEGSLCVNESDVTSIIPEVDFFPKQKTVVEETTVDYHAPRRRGAVHMRSHSPSPSPEGPSLPLFPSKDTYITQKESNESLSNSENAALLKEEEKPKSNSQSSLLLVFPKDAETTCV
ncbi:protein unc-80 homolog isoform X2 [Limulus polyphemus]|uniref:Protein unc-80 homolog isoform X2 n=1 Tax=Limulus polyphemus TaxID=6850 RepID=A0ABM1SZZ2_LIMPO|nr:protein unc-80 homolog isoform X2 [Limulus polyphemus]